ncbi:ATP-binding protein [Aestuariirhabdus litorea]|uniref:histidine kinase n=1 Tax=Aestuariirhabdus litorea TaxID=2528527 RepID=A0A3P3VS53_9GAMM|nr:ATP-binding protein [Aestuariirhabdus litorea]RRJ85147.1 response regulator [Aestuariirhabdus litorea]RWW98370.1 response regulator [Endozoicomonadaceae bacterium GTF-13]
MSMFLAGKNSGIKQRVLAMALLPTLSITLMLGVFFTLTRLKDLDNLLFERSLTIAEQFTATASFGYPADDSPLLQEVANAALEKSDVRAISLYNAAGTRIIHSGPGMLPVHHPASPFGSQQQILQGDRSLRIITPIYPPAENHLHSANELLAPLGWHEIEFSTANTEIKQYQTLLGSGVLIIVGVLLNIFLALRIGSHITRPLQKISNAVSHIRNGNLDTRINTETGGELRTLESGINSMVSSLQQAHHEMQQNIEQSTRDLQETLETIEIQNIELDMARKEALEASRIKSEFLANMSHEIRTPLNGIIGFTNLLLRSNLNERQREYLQTIHSSSEGLLAIINDVLDFSKIEAGKLELESIPMNLGDTIDEVLNILAPAAHEKQLELIPLLYSDTPTQLIGDPLRIKQILTNLVSNAIKFTHQGSITVRAMLEEQRAKNAVIKISVTDTGIGLSRQQQKELFKAFTQADTSTTRRIGGTGLGLVISKRLAQQMGGDIGLESEEGEGSTFWFTINVPLSSERIDKTPERHYPQRSALLLETQELVRQASGHLIRAMQLQLTSVDTAQELEAQLSDGSMPPYDLVILSHNEQLLPTSKLRQLLALPWAAHTAFLILVDTNKEYEVNRLLTTTSRALTIVKPMVRARLHKAVAWVLGSVPEANELSLPHDTPVEVATRAPHILAVDDNAANLKLVTVLLEGMGVQVTAVDSGQQAIVKVRQYRFDLIFMDVQMPDMDGMDTTRRIRDIELAEHRTPIVALTAHALAAEKKALLLAGMDDYMSKPISEPQLQQMIRKWTGIKLSLPSLEMSTRDSHPEHPPSRLIDLQEGVRLAGGKEDLAEEMLAMLLDNLPQDRQQIEQQYNDKQLPQLLETVHKLHGATRYCGVPLLRQACHEMESALKLSRRGEENSSLQQLWKELLTQIDALIQWHHARAESTTKATT